MKISNALYIFGLSGILLASCSDDDDTPEPVNEEELITTMTVTLTPQGGGNSITLQTRDLDGDGPDAPVVTVSGNFIRKAVVFRARSATTKSLATSSTP